MIKLDIEIDTGNFERRWNKNANRFTQALQSRLKSTSSDYAKNIKEEINRRFNLPKTGRIYSYKGKSHQASAPNEAPAVRSGSLLKSIFVKDTSVGLVNEFKIGSGLNYALFLEKGTKHMKPRPFLRISASTHYATFLANIKQSLKG